MEYVTLNNNRFRFELVLATGVGEEAYGLSFDRIGQMALSTSVFGSACILDFTYVENSESSVFGKVLPNGRAVLLLKFGYEDEKNYEWDLAFVVDYARLSENKGSVQTYRVRGIGFDCQTLRSRVPYSVESEDPLKTLLAMFSMAGMDVDSSSCPKSSGRLLPFISTANSTLLDSAEDLMDRASSARTVLFLAFSLSLGKYRLCNVGASLPGDSEVYVRNIPSSMAFSRENVGSFTEVEFRDSVSLVLDYPSYSDVVNHSFNYRSRSWSSSVIGGLVSAREALMQDGTGFSMFVSEQDRQRDMRFYMREDASYDQDGTIGRTNRYVASSFDLSGVSMIGSFGFESGGMLSMDESDNMSLRFGGTWMVCSVSHWFTKETWTTKALLSRLLVPRRS